MIKRNFLPNNKQTSKLTYIFHKNRKYEILRNGLKLHRWVSPGLRLQLHGLSAVCTMCNRIKWKLTTHSWSQRPDHRLTHIWCPGSWSVLISCPGRRNPRVADVAAFRTLPVSCLWRPGSGDTEFAIWQKRSVANLVRRQDSTKMEDVEILHGIDKLKENMNETTSPLTKLFKRRRRDDLFMVNLKLFLVEN